MAQKSTQAIRRTPFFFPRDLSFSQHSVDVSLSRAGAQGARARCLSASLFRSFALPARCPTSDGPPP